LGFSDSCFSGRVVTNIAAIVFMYNDALGDVTLFPFNDKAVFLGLADQSLFEKIVVACPPSISPGYLWRFLKWWTMVNQGLRVLRLGSEPEAILSRIMAGYDQLHRARGNVDIEHEANQTLPDSLTEDSESHGDKSLESSNLKPGTSSYNNQAAYEPTFGSLKVPGQTVILVVGETQQGKSKTINRLMGENVVPVRSSTALGSTTKVVFFPLSHPQSLRILIVYPTSEGAQHGLGFVA
jgi:hypothetical protein